MNSSSFPSTTLPALILVLTVAENIQTAAADALTFPQKRVATSDEVRQYQSLGQFVLAPDGSFFVYEWSRPYDWAPNYAGFTSAVGTRKQTTLYKVKTPDEWKPWDEPTSTELLPAAPGATYYLGSLSPDAKQLSFYEIDWDDNRIRAGVVSLTETLPPAKITWFDLAPDDKRLDRPVKWESNEEFVYPIKSGSVKLARANTKTGKAEPCKECTLAMAMRKTNVIQLPTHAVPGNDSNGQSALPAQAKLVAQSPDTALGVYAVDTLGVLMLLFKKGGRTVTLFENDRKPKSFVAAK